LTGRNSTRVTRGRLYLLVCVLLSASTGVAEAQTVPNSGELLQQTPRFTPAPPGSNPALTIQEDHSSKLDSGTSFLVKHIVIRGNSLLSTSELHALVEPSEGKLLSFSDLENLAARITKNYQDRGYLLSRAYIPAQTIRDATVRIEVLEARYGNRVLSNSSNVSDALLKSYLAPLKSGQPVAEDSLERSLLLLSDVPGAVVTSTLAPGAAPGTSDLQVTAAPGAPYTGSVTLDDAGNRYTGRARISGTAGINDSLRQGDVLSATGMTAGPDLDYGRLGYQTIVSNGEGTTLGGAVSSLYYHLEHGLSDLHADGTAEVESLTVMQPFVRSTAGNLFAQVGFDNKQLHDEIDSTDIHTDRRTDAFSMTLAGDRRDASGIFNINTVLTLGRLEFENTAAELADAASARTRGDYGKLTLSLARLQGLSESDSLYLAFDGQLANKNLDSSEQFFLGGPNSVRAYDVGSVGGALGALVSAELRHTLRLPVPGAWQAIAFVDSGVVRVNKDQFTTGENRANLSGVGTGLNWIGAGGWTATAALATPIGGRPSLAGDSNSMRVWVELRKTFTASPVAQ
jgi:hemolysin activation/secretion protein